MNGYNVFAYKSYGNDDTATVAQSQNRAWELGQFCMEKPITLADIGGLGSDMGIVHFNKIVECAQAMGDMCGCLDELALFITDESDRIMFTEKNNEWMLN